MSTTTSLPDDDEQYKPIGKSLLDLPGRDNKTIGGLTLFTCLGLWFGFEWILEQFGITQLLGPVGYILFWTIPLLMALMSLTVINVDQIYVIHFFGRQWDLILKPGSTLWFPLLTKTEIPVSDVTTILSEDSIVVNCKFSSLVPTKDQTPEEKEQAAKSNARTEVKVRIVILWRLYNPYLFMIQAGLSAGEKLEWSVNGESGKHRKAIEKLFVEIFRGNLQTELGPVEAADVISGAFNAEITNEKNLGEINERLKKYGTVITAITPTNMQYADDSLNVLASQGGKETGEKSAEMKHIETTLDLIKKFAAEAREHGVSPAEAFSKGELNAMLSQKMLTPEALAPAAILGPIGKILGGLGGFGGSNPNQNTQAGSNPPAPNQQPQPQNQQRRSRRRRGKK